jgi:hypothetical protein
MLGAVGYNTDDDPSGLRDLDLFQQFDADGSGGLSEQEFYQVCCSTVRLLLWASLQSLSPLRFDLGAVCEAPKSTQVFGGGRLPLATGRAGAGAGHSSPTGGLSTADCMPHRSVNAHCDQAAPPVRNAPSFTSACPLATMLHGTDCRGRPVGRSRLCPPRHRWERRPWLLVAGSST